MTFGFPTSFSASHRIFPFQMVAPTFALVAPSPTLPAGTAAPHYAPALAALTVLFFSFGFIICLNDILISYLKAIF